MEFDKVNIKKIFGIIAAAILFYTCLQHIDTVIDIFTKILAYLSPLIIGCIIAFIINIPMNFIERSFLGLRLPVKRKKRKLQGTSGSKPDKSAPPSDISIYIDENNEEYIEESDVFDTYYENSTLYKKNLNKETGKEKKSIRKKITRPLSLIITILLIIGAVMLVVLIVAPELSRTFGVIVTAGQNLINGEGNEWLDKVTDKYPVIEEYISKLNIDWTHLGNGLVQFLKNGIGGMFSSAISKVGSVINGVLNFVLGFVFAIYILLGKERLARQGKQIIYAAFKEKHADAMLNFLKLANIQFSNFVTGQCLDALLIGMMFFLGMNLFGFNYSLLISVVIGFTAIIPVFGSTIGCIFAILILVIDNPVRVIGFVILFIVIQQFDETFVYPNVVGNSVGLPAIWALAAVIIGGSMMGVLGMIIFIPITSIMYIMISNWTKKRLVKNGIDDSKWKKTEVVLSPGQLALLKKRRSRFIKSRTNSKQKKG